MKNKKVFFLYLILSIFFTQLLIAQGGYNNISQISERLKQLNTDYSVYTDLKSLAKTPGGHDIWLLSIGSGEIKNHPAIAIVGGVDGANLLSSELAIQFAEQLLGSSNSDSIKTLLSTTTFYVFPNLNPDASEQYFSALKYNRGSNNRQTDDDRDGRLNEDPYDDLNNDGFITLIRVKDNTGKWLSHPQDERVMKEADNNKGEFGTYKIYSEGIDNDKDGEFNEDGEGGVIFNKSLTFNYPHFTPGAGEYPVSETETRAFLDFLFDAWNVFAVLSFGESNNLSEPLRSSQTQRTVTQGAPTTGMGRGMRTGGRIVKNILPNDALINSLVSDKYNSIIGSKASSVISGTDGDFFQWAYFHYGRFSYSTPGWWVPAESGSRGPQGRIPGNLRAPTNRNEDSHPDIDFLKWADENNINNAFIPWQLIEHPDFPDKEVEVGGIAPYVNKNPPFNMVSDIAEKHYKFIVSLAEMKPKIDIININTEPAGKDLTRLSIDIYNKGLFSTTTGIGERTRWVRKVKVELKTTNSQTIITGKNIQLLGNIQSDNSEKISWLIKGKGDVKIIAGAPNTGIKEVNINIK